MLFVTIRRVKDTIKKNRSLSWITYSFGAFFLWFILLAVTHKLFEGSDWMVAFWMSWETMSTVGYGDAPAITAIGRIATMFGGTVGIITMSALMGAVIVFIEEIEHKRRHGMTKNPYKNSDVLVHFPGIQQFMAYARETRASEPDAKICIVDNELEKLPVEVENLGGIHFVRGSMLEEDVYNMVRLSEAKTVIVFPRNSDNVESDAMTSTLVGLILENVNESTKVIHILLDIKNKRLFKGLRSVPVLNYLEILSIVQEAQDDNSAPIIERLLRNTEGANPMSVKANHIVDMTWHDLQIRFAKVTQAENLNVNLLALVHDGNINLCPNAGEIIQEGDELSIITFDGFDWNSFESLVVN